MWGSSVNTAFTLYYGKKVTIPSQMFKQACFGITTEVWFYLAEVWGTWALKICLKCTVSVESSVLNQTLSGNSHMQWFVLTKQLEVVRLPVTWVTKSKTESVGHNWVECSFLCQRYVITVKQRLTNMMIVLYGNSLWVIEFCINSEIFKMLSSK